jgi:hypothetical protein
MYLPIVLLTMAVLPILSILIELAMGNAPDPVFLIGKWFVFWAVGARLFSGGINQILRPSFTSKGIFGTSDPGAERIVVEIGFGNVAIGLIALLSLFFPAWVAPAGFAGMIFLGLAGIRHAMNRDRKPTENIAMISDLGVAGILLVYLLMTLIVFG